jgi:hypothetical protein
LQVLIGLPTGRALPKKFFGGHIGIVVLVVCDFKDELIDFQEIVVHGVKCGLHLGNCWLKVE